MHSTAIAILNKSEEFVKNTTAASKYIPRRPRISINWNAPFQTSLHKNSKEIFFRLTKFFFRNKKNFSKEQLLFSFLGIVKQKKFRRDSKIFEIWVWKGGFQLMLILGLLGMYFDAAMVFFTISSLLFRMAMAMLCLLYRLLFELYTSFIFSC